MNYCIVPKKWRNKFKIKRKRLPLKQESILRIPSPASHQLLNPQHPSDFEYQPVKLKLSSLATSTAPISEPLIS